MTAAVESLMAEHPGRWQVDVAGTATEIWENNPHITRFGKDDDAISDIYMEYPLVHKSNNRHIPFLAAYVDYLADTLDVSIPLATNRPHLYLSDQERGWVSQIAELFGGREVPYGIVNAGVKSDFTAKQWPVEYYQSAVDATRDYIHWVQIGSLEHDHPPLENVIDLRGRTNTRQLIRLVYHSRVGMGPSTFLQHIYAAWEKPYICLLGGREPVTWVNYPLQHTLHTIGQLDCCRHGACWRSCVVGNGDSLCEYPMLEAVRPVGKCMAMIRPVEVISILRRLLG